MQDTMQFAKQGSEANGTDDALQTGTTALSPEDENPVRPQELSQTIPEAETAETFLSIGIMVGRHAEFEVTCLTSLFNQSLFGELNKRNLTCEIICVMGEERNQATSDVETVFQTQVNGHEHRKAFACHMIHVPERNRSAAWNAFVHASSEASSKFLFLIDGDIVLHQHDTLWNMFCTLVEKRDAVVVADEPVKDLAFKPRQTWFDKLSLAASHLALAGGTILPEQLYVIRADIARSIYLPDYLPMEGRFLATILSTDYLLKDPNEHRIIRAEATAHTYQANRSFRQVLRERKQRMINRTITFVLVEGYLRQLAQSRKPEMGVLLMQKDEATPPWLAEMVADHLRHRHFFWQLFPGASTILLKRLHRLPEMDELRYLPVGYLEQFITLIGCWMAYHSLKRQLSRKSRPDPIDLPAKQSRASSSL